MRISSGSDGRKHQKEANYPWLKPWACLQAKAHICYNTIYGIGEGRSNTGIGYICRADNSGGLWVRPY